MYQVGIGYLSPAQFSPGPNVINGAPSPSRFDAAPDSGDATTNNYSLVAVNIAGEDTVPGPTMTVPFCDSTTPNVTIYWLPVPGAAQYKVLRNNLRIATVGAEASKDANFSNFMSFKDTGQSTNAYTPVVFPCQHYLPFKTTSVESWTSPSPA